MRLLKFSNMEDLNLFLKDAANVRKVKVLTEQTDSLKYGHFIWETVFYVLIDDSNNYQN